MAVRVGTRALRATRVGNIIEEARVKSDKRQRRAYRERRRTSTSWTRRRGVRDFFTAGYGENVGNLSWINDIRRAENENNRTQ